MNTEKDMASLALENNEAENKADARDDKFKKALDMIASGKMELLSPIRAAGRDIKTVHWNFRNLTGWEYAQAMDMDGSANPMKVSAKQALCLFAVSCAKETKVIDESGKTIHPLDAMDVRQRLGIDDSMKAVQLAQVFFTSAVRAADKRILNE